MSRSVSCASLVAQGPAGGSMRRVKLLGLGLLVAGGAAWVWATGELRLSAADNIGVITGVVTSPKGQEAGVWVIAETDDLQTKFRKIVVTNDQGKFVLPELPKSVSYKVWVRGYGLADSKSVTAKPDQDLRLVAVLPTDAREAAQV